MNATLEELTAVADIGRDHRPERPGVVGAAPRAGT